MKETKEKEEKKERYLCLDTVDAVKYLTCSSHFFTKRDNEDGAMEEEEKSGTMKIG